MVAATASPALPLSPSPPLTSPARRPWKPDDDAHLIYRWVKMEGKSQSWVAEALNISQSTVSRMVQRYERWQAHAKEREDGRLDPAERLRASRWLTFERNELILASCLRIANEMEGFIDTSRSTIRRSAHSPSQESEVRTEHACVDRTGMTARFLRLAFRINMEQLKLAELDQPPPAQPLTEEELAAEERQAEADAAELAASRAAASGSDAPRGNPDSDAPRPEPPPQSPLDQSPAEPSDAERLAVRSHAERGNDADKADSSLTYHSLTHDASSLVHNLHNENPPEIAASIKEPCSCGLQIGITKNSIDLCIIDCDQPSWPGDDVPSDEESALETARSG